MGTIAQKLEYLNDTRLLLKDNINKINNVLDDNSTFRSYPQELFNGYLDILNNGTDTLWNNLEKVSQTGTEAVLEGVETAPMKVELQGNTSQDGTPTPDTPVEVKVVKGENVVSVSGKNLLNDIEVKGGNGIVATLNNDGSISYNGIATATNSYLTNWITSNIPIGNYTFSINSPLIDYNARIQFTYEDSTTGSFNIPKPDTSLIIDLTKKVVQYRLVLQNIIVDTEYNGTLYFQLEQGTEATDYVPYTKTEYPINLGNIELCKIGDYKDYLFKRNGKWYVHKEIGKVVLDENTIFEGYQSFGNYYRGQKKIQDAKIFENNNIEIFSNYFKGNINVFTSTKAEVGNMGQYKNTIDFYFISTQPTQADFKTWLETNNVTLYYVLATPTEEEITNSTLIEQLEAIYKAKSVKDKTYITQTNDELPFILDVSAIKEYEVN